MFENGVVTDDKEVIDEALKNWLENYNSSVRVLWVDVWDWLENVEW